MPVRGRIGIEVVRADADGLYVIADGLRRRERHAPVGDKDFILAALFGRGNVLAAGEYGGGDGAGIGEERLGLVHGEELAAVHDGDLAAHVIRLVAVVRDHDDLAPEAREQVAHLDHELAAEVRVERGERLVEQQKLRVADHDARKRRALRLTAGQLRRAVVLKPVELEHVQHLCKLFLFLRLVLLAAHAAEDVLPHGHVRKERVVLEEIAHVPLLRREVYALLAVVEDDAVKLNVSGVRLFYPGDAFERHALAAAGGTEQTGHAVLRLEPLFKLEAAELFLYVHNKAHLFTLTFCLLSRRLTVRSTTVLMARFIMTQKNAPASSFVRQSW